MKRDKALQNAVAIGCAALFLWFCIPVAFGLLGIGNGFGMASCAVLFWFSRSYPRAREHRAESAQKRRVFVAHRVLLCLIILFVFLTAALTGCMIAGASRPPPAGATIVVLGSKVDGTTPSADLAARIQTAAAYARQHPYIPVVASGGQGSDEEISEARAIQQGLIAAGVEESRIFLEDRSVSTEQNLAYTIQIVKNNGFSTDLAIVTDEYHQFRAGRLAARAGGVGYAVCSPTPWYIFPACYVRELLAIVYDCLFFPVLK